MQRNGSRACEKMLGHRCVTISRPKLAVGHALKSGISGVTWTDNINYTCQPRLLPELTISQCCKQHPWIGRGLYAPSRLGALATRSPGGWRVGDLEFARISGAIHDCRPVCVVAVPARRR
jgi:hypothetical protein